MISFQSPNTPGSLRFSPTVFVRSILYLERHLLSWDCSQKKKDDSMEKFLKKLLLEYSNIFSFKGRRACVTLQRFLLPFWSRFSDMLLLKDVLLWRSSLFGGSESGGSN
ncbi:hypothetical protein CDAR_546271 [Caerostris darwini]|uniref:Maturase K n=1 Tax=Caerostris darwini TaxID=1538125 RepID=A0AAV4RNI7_9ARAC|nr:hypothetical protein CDAR_546271 [Caerostris darwini]